jgi:hypothetical protein
MHAVNYGTQFHPAYQLPLLTGPGHLQYVCLLIGSLQVKLMLKSACFYISQIVADCLLAHNLHHHAAGSGIKTTDH